MGMEQNDIDWLGKYIAENAVRVPPNALLPTEEVDGLIERLRQVARRHRQYGCSMDEKFDRSCDLTLGDLDTAADAIAAMRALAKPDAK